MPARVKEAFLRQARAAAGLGSPFMARLMTALPNRLADAPQLCRRILAWQGPLGPNGASVPLRLAGGLHALVRAGAAPGLAACYPPHSGAGLEAALAETLRAQDDWLCSWMTHAPQTNEVGRSAVLLAAAAALTARFGLPLRLSELGASAGLNLNFDRYMLQAGPVRIGRPSPVLLAPEWRGAPPDPARTVVACRRGVDLNPLDPGRDGERLAAFVWPDQADRLARLEAALKIATRHPGRVDRGDAADWLEQRLAERGGGHGAGAAGLGGDGGR